jgi:hypothetical protein
MTFFTNSVEKDENTLRDEELAALFLRYVCYISEPVKKTGIYGRPYVVITVF